MSFKTSQPFMSVTDVRKKVIESKTKTDVIKHLLAYMAQTGINSDAGPEWWEKRQKLGV